MDVFDPNIVHSEVFDESQQNGSKMQMDDLFDLASLTKYLLQLLHWQL